MTKTTTISTTAKAALIGLLMSGAATGAFAKDDRDARILALEAQVQALAAQINDLKQSTTATSAQVADLRQQSAATPAQVADLKQSIATTNAQVAEVKETTAATSEQVADLKQSTTASIADVRTIATATPVTIANGKPTIASADGSFSATLHGVLQLDTANYSQKTFLAGTPVVGPDLNSGTNFRRARFGIDGRLFGNFDYDLLFDFGGSGTDSGAAGSLGGTITNGSGAHLHEGWIQYSGYRIADLYTVRARIGAFPPSLGLEDAGSTSGSLFLERPSSAEIARSIAGGEQRVGGQLQSNGDHWLAAVAVTGAKTGDPQTFDEQLGYTGRIAGTPFFGQDWRIHVGFNGSYVQRPAQGTALSNVTSVSLSDRPELRVDGTQLITTGGIDAAHVSHYGGEAAFQKGPFLIQSEYFQYQIDRRIPIAGAANPHFDGWYAEAAWTLSGEQRRYNNITGAFDAPAVAHPLDVSHNQFGAFELAARYSDTDLNYNAGVAGAATPLGGVRGGEQRIWAAGLNWYPNPDIKFGLQYQWVDINRLNATGVQIGQSYNAVALRSQVAF
jgi:phosphate-selective porin OprO/OprP